MLGGGGTVGLSYHAGALRALEQVGGLRPHDTGLIVGTSAGSVAAAYLRSGWGTEDLWGLALGTHPSVVEAEARNTQMFSPKFRNAPELARRTLGSSFVLGRSVVRSPAPVAPPGWLGRLFPGGLFDMAGARSRFAADLPQAWPERPLWLCTVDVANGRRVVLGQPGAPVADLHRAVLASCAIPGLYQPVRLDGRTLVDGGAKSHTNLDLVAAEGWDLVIAVAPTAFDPSDRPGTLVQLVRRGSTRRLAAEAALARRRGSEVLLVRPAAAAVHAQGYNLMRSTGWARVALAAYDTTARVLETPRFRSALAA